MKKFREINQPDLIVPTSQYSDVFAIYRWIATRKYNAGDMVKYGNTLYMAASTHTASTSFATDWLTSNYWTAMSEPPGTILMFAGAVAPTGYLFCDGSEISQTTYSVLYAAIGITYNQQINPTTGIAWALPSAGNFRVPDYRATFLRGVGTPYQGDAQTLGGWQVNKTKGNGLAIGTGSIHSHGIGADGTHAHRVTKSRNDEELCDDYFGGPIPTPPYTAGGVTNTIGTRLGGNHSHGGITGDESSHVHGFSSEDSETRPHNKGVNYIIRY